MGNNALRILLAVLVMALLAAGFIWLFSAFGGSDAATGEAATPETTLCPQATPEYFDVYPVTSPTGELSQVISAELGNGEVITVTTDSGVFAAPVTTYPTEITIDLLPDTTHTLLVEGRVREIQQGDCTYGGYILSATRDRDGGPLVIEQQP